MLKNRLLGPTGWQIIVHNWHRWNRKENAQLGGRILLLFSFFALNIIIQVWAIFIGIKIFIGHLSVYGTYPKLFLGSVFIIIHQNSIKTKFHDSNLFTASILNLFCISMYRWNITSQIINLLINRDNLSSFGFVVLKLCIKSFLDEKKVVNIMIMRRMKW